MATCRDQHKTVPNRVVKAQARAEQAQTDPNRVHDAIGDDFSAVVMPADLPRTSIG